MSAKKEHLLPIDGNLWGWAGVALRDAMEKVSPEARCYYLHDLRNRAQSEVDNAQSKVDRLRKELTEALLQLETSKTIQTAVKELAEQEK